MDYNPQDAMIIKLDYELPEYPTLWRVFAALQDENLI